jgi:hypothetical protein
LILTAAEVSELRASLHGGYRCARERDSAPI